MKNEKNINKKEMGLQLIEIILLLGWVGGFVSPFVTVAIMTQ